VVILTDATGRERVKLMEGGAKPSFKSGWTLHVEKEGRSYFFFGDCDSFNGGRGVSEDNSVVNVFFFFYWRERKRVFFFRPNPSQRTQDCHGWENSGTNEALDLFESRLRKSQLNLVKANSKFE
jgi:hypothetical protein